MRTQRRVYQRDWLGGLSGISIRHSAEGWSKVQGLEVGCSAPAIPPAFQGCAYSGGRRHARQLWETTSPARKQSLCPPREGRTGPKPRTRGSQSENWSGPWQDGAYSREHGLHQEIGVCILKRTLHLCMPWVSRKHGPCHSWWLKTERDSVQEVHCQPHGIRLEVSLTVSQGPLEFLLSFSPNPRAIKFTACWSYLQTTCRIQLWLTALPLI